MYKDSYKGKVKIVFVICTGMGRESPIESRVAQHRRAARAARDVDDAPGLQQRGVGGGGGIQSAWRPRIPSKLLSEAVSPTATPAPLTSRSSRTQPGAVSTSLAVRLCSSATTSGAPSAAAAALLHLQERTEAAVEEAGKHSRVRALKSFSE